MKYLRRIARYGELSAQPEKAKVDTAGVAVGKYRPYQSAVYKKHFSCQQDDKNYEPAQSVETKPFLGKDLVFDLEQFIHRSSIQAAN